MAGYSVDPEALEGAIKELEDIRDDIRELERQAQEVKPGELTANDTYTNKARQVIQERATGEEGSLRKSSRELYDKLGEKIKAYQATLDEYRRSDDDAAVDVGRIH